MLLYSVVPSIVHVMSEITRFICSPLFSAKGLSYPLKTDSHYHNVLPVLTERMLRKLYKSYKGQLSASKLFDFLGDAILQIDRYLIAYYFCICAGSLRNTSRPIFLINYEDSS